MHGRSMSPPRIQAKLPSRMSTRIGVHHVAAPIAAKRPAAPPMNGVLARTTGSSRVGSTKSGSEPWGIGVLLLGRTSRREADR